MAGSSAPLLPAGYGKFLEDIKQRVRAGGTLGSGLGYCDLVSSLRKLVVSFSFLLLIWSVSFLWCD